MPHRVKIYQINTDRDKERLIFAGSDVLMKNNRNLHFKYFDASIFKKGTCHLKFTDEAVVDALNIYVGKHKGWLPPSYGKVSYDEMNAEEQAVIDDFQGKEQYAKILANPSKYLFETSAMLALPSEKTEK